MRKKWGIPLFLIAILAVAGIAVAAYTAVFVVQLTVQRPQSEKRTMTYTFAAGESFMRRAYLDLSLPITGIAPYTWDLTYKFTGDSNDLLENENATIWLDTNDSHEWDEGEPENSMGLGDTVTFTGVEPGEICHIITISGDAKNNVLVTTAWQEENQDPGPAENETTLTVSVVITKTGQ